MAQIYKDLTVAIRVTDPEWGRRAAAVAFGISRWCQPAEIRIVGYEAAGDRTQRYSSGYEALLPVRTPWLLSIDADSYVQGDVGFLVGFLWRGARVALRQSPLQATGRNGWDEEAYKGLFETFKLPYRQLGTTCAFLLAREKAKAVLDWVGWWRRRIDETGVKLSKSYHVAQAAFALALAHAGVGERQTWWLSPDELSFEGEPRGIIHHEALKKYKLPIREVEP